MIGKNRPEKLLEEIVKLDTVEFLGVCKILGVKIYDVEEEVEKKDTDVEVNVECGQATAKVNLGIEPRGFEDIWNDLCDVVENLNRTRRRNLGKIIYAATSKEKE